MKRVTYTMSGAGEDFGPRADGMVTGHTWEGSATATTVADALKGVAWQDEPDVLGSYNDVICSDGIISSVPPSHASGGINPGSADWAPEPWLYTVLEPEQVANPNYFTRNVCFFGRKSYYDQNGWPPQMIDAFVTVMLEEEQRIGRKVVLTQHEDFQTNRSDAGPIADKLIRQRYLERTGMDWINIVKYVRPYRALIRKEATYRRAPDLVTPGGVQLTTDNWRDIIGEVNGVDFGSGPLWLVLVSGSGGFKVVHSQDAIDRDELVVDDGGISDAEVNAKVAAAIATEKARIRSVLGI